MRVGGRGIAGCVRRCPVAGLVGAAAWERPLTYLSLCAGPEVIEPLLAETTAISSVEEPEYKERLHSRRGRRLFGSDAHWTEDDYNVLLDAVAWMRETDADETPLSAEDIARIPGPNDIALFDIEVPA